MFIQHPHDLRSVHCRTAAQRQNNIRFKLPHLLSTLLGTGQGRIWLYIRKELVCNPQTLQLIGDAGRHAAACEELVGHNKCTFLMQNFFQFPHCHWQTALLKVYFLRGSEPQHILSPLSNRLNVQQVANSNIF